ncbi:MAG: hypothetical protein RLZ98_2352 [Pseudomonadota bacterium]|jgi:CspA family cold shock protein
MIAFDRTRGIVVSPAEAPNVNSLDFRTRAAEYEEVASLSASELAERHDPELVKLRFRQLFAAAEEDGTGAERVAANYATISESWCEEPNAPACMDTMEGLELFEVAGAIKWFDASKGYGFIVPDNGTEDVLLHVTCLRAGGYQTAYEGARVHVQCLQRPRGRQAFRILSMDCSSGVHPAQLPQRTHYIVQVESDWERAIVKWFNRVRGFGFLTRVDGAIDIFIHMETLRRFGFAELRPGQVVQVRWGSGSKGRVAAELRPDDTEHTPILSN